MTGRTYRIQVAAQVSGVKEGLIRAWERRYGVLHPLRTPAGYRTYSEADIEVLKRLKQMTEEGVAIAQAVKLLPRIRREAKEATAHSSSVLKVVSEEQWKAWQEEILEASALLDQPLVEAILEEASSSAPPILFYDQLIAPLLREVGERWHRGVLTVAAEHLISYAARSKLMRLLAGAPRRAKHHVVCACPPHDEHDLGLLGAAVRFRHAGWRVTFLGANTPVAQLALAVRTLKPDLVAISAIEASGPVEFMRELADALPAGTQVLLGGQGIYRHAELAATYGFLVAEPGADWTELVRTEQ